MDDLFGQLLTIAEAAKLTGVAKTTITRARGRGEFPRAQQKQGTWYIPIGDLISSGRLDTITHTTPEEPASATSTQDRQNLVHALEIKKTTRALRRTTTAPGPTTHPSQTRHHRRPQNNHQRTRDHPAKTTHHHPRNPPLRARNQAHEPPQQKDTTPYNVSANGSKNKESHSPVALLHKAAPPTTVGGAAI